MVEQTGHLFDHVAVDHVEQEFAVIGQALVRASQVKPAVGALPGLKLPFGNEHRCPWPSRLDYLADLLQALEGEGVRYQLAAVVDNTALPLD